jgi:hypothetical protein
MINKFSLEIIENIDDDTKISTYEISNSSMELLKNKGLILSISEEANYSQVFNEIWYSFPTLHEESGRLLKYDKQETFNAFKIEAVNTPPEAIKDSILQAVNICSKSADGFRYLPNLKSLLSQQKYRKYLDLDIPSNNYERTSII